jgi:drug/metabolite transporter (DMT)-like permease
MSAGINNKARAIVFAILAVGTASFQDAIVKGVSGNFPASEVLVFRALGSLPILLPMLWYNGEWRQFFARDTKLLFARSAVLCSAYLAFILSIAAMPIATSVSIYFTMPFFVAGLAGPSLGEKVPLYRWVAIAAAFVGVLVMVRPDTGNLNPAMFLALYSAFGYAVGQLIGRKLSQTVDTSVLANWQNLVYGVAGLLLGLFFAIFDFSNSTDKSVSFLARAWHWPNATEFATLMVMGLLAALGSILFVTAYKNAEANFVAPFEYTALIWATLYGVLLFNDYPERQTLQGVAIVIAAGIFMLWFDLKNKKSQTTG